MTWVYQKGTPVNHLRSPVTVAHSPPLEHLCFISTPHVQFDLVLWLLHVCCSLRVFMLGLTNAQHDFGEMEMLIRRVSQHKIVLFDCAISSENPRLTSNEMAEGNVKLWKQLDQPPALNVKGEKIQFGSCIKQYYCNRNQTPFSHGFLKEQDPVAKFNEEKWEWTPVTPFEARVGNDTLPTLKRKMAAGFPASQVVDARVPTGYQIPKKAARYLYPGTQMVSLLQPISDLQDTIHPPTDSAQTDTISEETSPGNVSVSHDHQYGNITSPAQTFSPTVFIQQDQPNESCSDNKADDLHPPELEPAAPPADWFDPQHEPEGYMISGIETSDPLAMKVVEDWDPSGFYFPKTPPPPDAQSTTSTSDCESSDFEDIPLTSPPPNLDTVDPFNFQPFCPLN